MYYNSVRRRDDRRYIRCGQDLEPRGVAAEIRLELAGSARTRPPLPPPPAIAAVESI